jgi:LppP/LprE lipoprotein
MRAAANTLAVMSRRLATAALLAVAALAGCGGGTKTVTVSSAPAPPASYSSTSTSAAASPTTSTTTSASASTSGAATRTASAPAFTSQSASAGTGAGATTAAAAVVRAHGYTPNDTSQYHGDQTLGVLVGTHTGSGDGYGQQAFFFVNGRYIGTDSAQPSATLRVVEQKDTRVTLAYPLYRSHDALCCPSGGEARVTFELDNGKLTPRQAIPPANSQAGLSRQ